MNDNLHHLPIEFTDGGIPLLSIRKLIDLQLWLTCLARWGDILDAVERTGPGYIGRGVITGRHADAKLGLRIFYLFDVWVDEEALTSGKGLLLFPLDQKQINTAQAFIDLMRDYYTHHLHMEEAE